MGLGLEKFSQTWDILLIYYNNQLKKYIAPLLRLARGALSIPILMSMLEAFSIPFHILIKLCYTKALEWSSLVPGPKAESSSEIMNLTLFIVSSHFGDSLHVLNPSNTIMILFYDAHLDFFRRTSQDICFAISLEKIVCLFFFSLLKWFSVLLSSWMWTCLKKSIVNNHNV